ncbi:PTS sugar transporter subunit IIA [Desulfosarcina sp. OttesenSCG-928-A07]|nr:PTS sugar transporter subunit IIA [Desulfosarcina sp. OttesenSCG-928-G17]MDL2329841.1 PTS sugar transporter subunit IIA [Desulfosarcina sp. OttesenSCG-928-A07]
MKITLKKIASAFDLPVPTLERWIRQGRIPVQRSGDEVLFSRPALEKWAAAHNLSFHMEKTQPIPLLTAPPDTLSAAMAQGNVYSDVEGESVDKVLKAAVDRMTWLSPDVRDELFFRLMDRERLASTGIGGGIAIPHPRDPLSPPPEKAMVTTCFLVRPVAFGAIDDLPVNTLFLLISPTVKLHLHLLSRLSYCIRNAAFAEFLKTRPDAAALVAKVSAIEAQLDKA